MRLVIVIMSRRVLRTMIALMVLAALLPSVFTGLVAVMNGRLLRSRVDVVIDPGHGGVDPGANDHDTVEKEITLAVSLKMRDMLVRYGLSVGLTRDSDTDCSGWAELRSGRHQADLNARAARHEPRSGHDQHTCEHKHRPKPAGCDGVLCLGVKPRPQTGRRRPVAAVAGH